MIIKGFWHIYLINHWYSIVTDQMRILLTSGLYDECQEIKIGCLGSKEEHTLLEKLFVNLYPKLKIEYYSNIPENYEFSTLRLIEADKSRYLGFYFHTKAVTRPAETIINHWRAWLNESVLNQWREHRDNVALKFDLSSVNYLRSPDHFSGNFWWFNRNYIDRLPAVDSLDENNRFYAEQWICMGHPRLCSADFKEPGADVFLMQYKP